MKVISFVIFATLVIFVYARTRRSPFPPTHPRSDRLNNPQKGYEVRYYAQTLDHFNLASQPQTFQQRYLYNDTFWGSKKNIYQNASSSLCPGPILFYTGNESPVTDYWAGSGFFTEVLAPHFGALLVFAEHRYFGDSMPFGPTQSWDYGKINFLSSEQALADYAQLITDLKENILTNAKDCPVVSFGGSYGGMLTAWFRSKYPNIVIGGLAASAPFNFPNTPNLNPYLYGDTEAATYAAAAPGCDSKLGAELLRIQNLSMSDTGRAALTEEYQLCSPLLPNDDLLGYTSDALADMAMLDYPYPTDYGIPLPAWPVNTTCSLTLQSGLGKGLQTFWGNGGANQCLNMTRDVPDFAGCCGWDYLRCSEIYQPFAQRGIWLPHYAWNLAGDIAACKAQFNITLRPYFAAVQWMGGYDFAAGSSNIIFSNGMLDPWHTSGVTHTLSSTLPAILIPAAAHHLDLRAPNPADPPYVAEARVEEERIITSWLDAYWQSLTRGAL